MILLKIIQGKPDAGFIKQEQIIPLVTDIDICLLGTPSQDRCEERKEHPEEAIYRLGYNGIHRYIYPRDSAFVINESGGTLRKIHHGSGWEPEC